MFWLFWQHWVSSWFLATLNANRLPFVCNKCGLNTFTLDKKGRRIFFTHSLNHLGWYFSCALIVISTCFGKLSVLKSLFWKYTKQYCFKEKLNKGYFKVFINLLNKILVHIKNTSGADTNQSVQYALDFEYDASEVGYKPKTNILFWC